MNKVIGLVLCMIATIASAQQAPRQKLASQDDIIDFIHTGWDAGHAVILSFFKADEEGGIANRESADGAFAQFKKIEGSNPKVARGWVVSNELAETFGVNDGTHFVQVVGKEDDASRFTLHNARFYSPSGELVADQPGKLVAMVTGNNVHPMSDKNTVVAMS